jgi:copper chaperone CopZ
LENKKWTADDDDGQSGALDERAILEDQMIKKTYRVNDMHCPNCAMNIEGIEDDLPGVKQVLASYQKGQMVVEFDESKVSEAQILAAVEKRGYQASPA